MLLGSTDPHVVERRTYMPVVISVSGSPRLSLRFARLLAQRYTNIQYDAVPTCDFVVVRRLRRVSSS